MLLRRDDLEWRQIKGQVLYKLHNLKNMDWVTDFVSDIEEVSKALEKEGQERSQDDQGIINMVNDVC